MSKLLTMADLARRLGRSVHTIANDRSRRPHALPPAISVEGTRYIRWREETVEAWLAANERPACPPPEKTEKVKQTRRGRPPKPPIGGGR